ncbi:patatin-like phospholipase family protein [Amorphus orientalis]
MIDTHYNTTCLVLQGGGALGAYQAGVAEVLCEANIDVDWVAGISIGAINAAIIAGNPPEKRVERLRSFWNKVTSGINWPHIPEGDDVRAAYNQVSSMAVMTFGVPGFFQPRFPPPFFQADGSTAAASFYDTTPLKHTLESLVDFDYLNDGPVRLSVGAVNVRSGNFAYFDTAERRIGPEHIMASGALPPGFPPVEIEGELYWDGGLVSNTPLSYIIDSGQYSGTLVFQVDLFSARGPRPRNLQDVNEREKDIRFSSRTRLNTNMFRRMQEARQAISTLLEKLPEDLQNTPEARRLRHFGRHASVNVFHLIYRRKLYDQAFKDYEFSRNTMIDHWKAGASTMRRSLRHTDWFNPPDPEVGFVTHDVDRDAED